MLDMTTLGFMLLFAHVLGDWALQNDFTDTYKNPKNRHPQIKETIWPWALSAHTLIHGGLVFLATFNLWLGITEFAAHTLIDWLKGRGVIGFHTDQMLHLLCKLVYVGLVATGMATAHMWYAPTTVF